MAVVLLLMVILLKILHRNKTQDDIVVSDGVKKVHDTFLATTLSYQNVESILQQCNHMINL